MADRRIETLGQLIRWLKVRERQTDLPASPMEDIAVTLAATLTQFESVEVCGRDDLTALCHMKFQSGIKLTNVYKLRCELATLQQRSEADLNWLPIPDFVKAYHQLVLRGSTRTKPPPRKRGNRAANIEALKNELIEHLRTARDHAYATKDSEGGPQLLPRPTKKELAKRAKVENWDVTRCFKDESAHELRLLWDVAEDIDQITKWKTPAGSRRRS